VHETTPPGRSVPLPERIGRLLELAYNLWWTWQPDAQDLFGRLDVERWNAVAHNPILILNSLGTTRLKSLSRDGAFVSLYDRVCAAFDEYMQSSDRAWFPSTHPDSSMLVAYFCAEYGVHESFPMYSGGLGVLAGDHCKTASDLGLPFVAVGLWYTQGFFRQLIDEVGQQVAAPDNLDQLSAPLQYAGKAGADLIVEVPCANRHIYARVWRVQVGRVPIYLLDTDVDENSPPDRALCSRLYGGDKETRIAQEVVLGVGGVRALRALGLSPTCWHMNEGHAGFMALERVHELKSAGVPYAEALKKTVDTTVFTTHTPVPAGNEVFRNDLVLTYLPSMAQGKGLATDEFLGLAHQNGSPAGSFAMTPLALKLSHRANGVSKLHGAVAREMWVKQYPDITVDDVPITSITNGVHSPTWIAPEIGALIAKHLGADWLSNVDDPRMWDKIDLLPDEELWAIHRRLKERMLVVVSSLSTSRVSFDPNALTIGFARRFATYKRATLFFRDLDRATRILTNAKRPVQILFAGKAHPADGGGQGMIKAIDHFTKDAATAAHVALLPGYDLALARTLVRGVDLWLNNPERPQEASGTSGEKAALNGVPNCSIRDGWWDEGYDGKNGWAFGGERGDDEIDSRQLYDVLENEVIPTFYDRTADDLPRRWVATMKESIRSCAPAFSAQRMVKEYVERLYL
jgi:starch phosphorylase